MRLHSKDFTVCRQLAHKEDVKVTSGYCSLYRYAQKPAVVSIQTQIPDKLTFLGIGVMGYPMAKNLRAGLSGRTTLLVCDVSKEALDRFRKETEGQGPVEVVENGFEAAKAAVSG